MNLEGFFRIYGSINAIEDLVIAIIKTLKSIATFCDYFIAIVVLGDVANKRIRNNAPSMLALVDKSFSNIHLTIKGFTQLSDIPSIIQELEKELMFIPPIKVIVVDDYNPFLLTKQYSCQPEDVANIDNLRQFLQRIGFTIT